MRIALPASADPPKMHLTYCLNIHPGESWRENFAAISNHATRVRDAVAGGKAFGLGLRLSNEAAEQLAQPQALDEFRAFLARENMYVFTINGFPYGRFHGAAVKADVYQPDWRRPERRDYTMRLIDILAALLPEGVSGSISTVPGSYKQWIRTDDDVQQMAGMLAGAVCHAAVVRERTGKDICIALEGEPDCFIESTSEAIEFVSRTLPTLAGRLVASQLGCDEQAAVAVLKRHVGMCLDTAHMAVQFEDIAESLRQVRSAGVRVGKVQLSSALRLAPTADALHRLRAFIDPVYLHQVKVHLADGMIASFADLPEAIAVFEDNCAESTLATNPCQAETELRVHFHVPLFFTQAGPLASTSSLLGPGFWREVALSTDQLEIETYTFDVLPDSLRAADVVESIRREYEWAISHAE